MTRFHLAILLSSFLFITCKKAAVDAPQGIKALIAGEEKHCDSPCPVYFNEYRWKEDIIYVKTCSNHFCLCSHFLYDATGQRITPPQGITELDVVQQSTFLREVWRCPKK